MSLEAHAHRQAGDGPVIGPDPAGAQEPLIIGLVNNMPDAAFAATEAQFEGLIYGAQGARELRLKRFYMPEIPRSDALRDSIAATHLSTRSLKETSLDALIVTGAEPRAADLRQEPYWSSLVELIDWSRMHTGSTLWSCLAAHAAVLHLDGVERRALPEKCTGVFSFAVAEPHPLINGFPGPVLTPHSRLNGLDETELRDRGYSVLTRSDHVGVDIFIKDEGSLFVFFQGHPEYDAGSLMLEYRRDVRRLMQGDISARPQIPRGYFTPRTEKALTKLAARISSKSLLPPVSECLQLITAEPPEHRWGRWSAQLFRNWINLIEARSLLSVRG